MAGSTPKRPFDGVRVTLIDDDASVRRGISRFMRSFGFSCLALESGELALADPSVAQSDCLIMDVHLTGIDGFETRDRLQARGIHLPVVFITAHGEFDSPEWVARRRGSPCLSKPFDGSTLISAIRAMLEARSD